jgi:hypothetical protein
MVLIVAASTLTDVLASTTVMPQMETAHAPDWQLAVALAYRTLFGIAGGWLTARLAPGRPMTHAIVLGAIGTAASIAGLVVMWSVGQHWYPVALVILALPQCWFGGRLAAQRTRLA